MDHQQLAAVFDTVVGDAHELLLIKGGEYAVDTDALSNFRKAADLQGVRMRDALGGMMAKHTVSIYDMLNDDADFPSAKWDEKILDHINYLILLRAIILEEQSA